MVILVVGKPLLFGNFSKGWTKTWKGLETWLGETVGLLNLKWNFQFPKKNKKTFVFFWGGTIKIAHKKRGIPKKR